MRRHRIATRQRPGELHKQPPCSSLKATGTNAATAAAQRCIARLATGRAGRIRHVGAAAAAAVLRESSSSDARHSISGTMIVTKLRYFDIVVVGENRKIWTWPSRAERRPLITNTCKSRVTTSSASLRDLIFLTIFYICTYSLSRELPPLPVLVASSK